MVDADASQNLKFFLPLIYVIPSYILYVVIICIIFFSKIKHKFSGSFYKLLGFSAMYNLISSIIYFLNIRMMKTPIFIPFVNTWGTRGVLVTFLHTFTWYLTNATHLFNFMLPFNRFTVFFLRTSYQKFWTRYLKIFLGFCVLFPILLIWHIPFTDIFIKLENDSNVDGTRYLTELHPEVIGWMNNPRNFAVLITLTSSMSLLMNIYVIVKLMQQRYCQSFESQLQGKVSPQDIKLTMYSMLIFATEVVNCAQQYAFITATDFNFIMAMFEIQFYVVDITTLAPAWFIFFTHQGLRKQIALFLRLKRFTEPRISATGNLFVSKRNSQTSHQ